MFYQSSKGPVEIAKMPFPYASNALKKLCREEPERTDEIAALEKHVTALAVAGDAPENPRAVIGGNMPPEEVEATPQTWAALKLHMDDLLDQVRGVTGIEITDQRGADQIGKLLVALQNAAKAAEAARVAEKAPFDEAIKEIQDRFNEYIAPTKNKTPGLVSKAEVALKNQIAAWLRKLEDERIERERVARAAAQKAEEEARQAHIAARESDDLDEIDAAEDLIAAADDAARDLKRVEKEKVAVKVEGARAKSLRSVWKAVRIPGEGGKALQHYARTKSDRVIEFMQQLADEDVKAGVRSIPGFEVKEERVL